MKYSLLILLSIVFWAVFSPSSAAQDTSFVPMGVDLSVNPHAADIGKASRCINFYFDNGKMVKRPGYVKLSRSTDRDFTGIWTYIDDDGDKRLIGCAQNTANNYQSLYVSSEYSYDVGVTSLQDYIYLDETGTGAVYNGIFIFANGKNRPYRYNGTDFQPLVEVPPGSFDFAPEKPSDSTNQVLRGKYFYGWQAAFPDSLAGDSMFYHHADSMNLDGPSWQIATDSDWVRVFSPPFTGPTVYVESSDSTYIRLCRTRGGAVSSDSMFRIYLLGYDSTDFDYTCIDSIPDESLGVKEYWTDTSGTPTAYFVESACPNGIEAQCDSTRISHPFAGFIDTVSHIVSDTTSAQMDSTYKIGQPQLLSIDSLNYHYGISADDSYLGTVTYRRWIFCWYDSSTGMMTQPGPDLRVPADSVDSIVNIITPVFDTSKPYWGILARAEEILVTIDSTVLTASDLNDNGWTVWGGYGNWIYYYPIDGECRPGDQSFDRGDRISCAAPRIVLGDSTYQTGPYYPVCTVKTVTGFCDTIADSFSASIIQESAPVPLDQQTIGQLDNICILQDRILMSQGSKVYFNGFTSRGSEMAYWPIGNAFAVGNNDGDVVTGLHAGNKYADVFKNYTWYQAEETGTNQFTVTEIKNNIGCVSHHSIVDLPMGGLAFLSPSEFYIHAPAWQSLYKSTGGNVNPLGGEIKEHLKGMTFEEKSECYGWMSQDREKLIFSFPSQDTSLVLSDGQWSQWNFAPRMTAEYDISPYRYYGLLPCSGTVFIEYDSDSLFRFGGVAQDTSGPITTLWKSLELYQTGGYGKIDEFRVWKYSNSDTGIDFNVYDVFDTGSVATRRDTAVYRVKRKDIDCPESEAFKIEITSNADSLAIDRIDVKYTPTGPMPVD